MRLVILVTVSNFLGRNTKNSKTAGITSENPQFFVGFLWG